MAWWEWPARIGGWAASPWTGGASAVAAEGAIGAFGGDKDKQSKPDKDNAAYQPFLNQLQQSSSTARAQGQDFMGMSSESLAPVLNYLKALTGADPGALMDATRQERGRVMDQYDTARKAIAQFGPRGGGTTSVLAESQFKQGESLADITSNARSDAVTQLSSLGPQLAALGISSQQLASADLNTIINMLLTREGFDITKRGQTMEMWGGIGQAAGQIITDIILGRKKPAGAAA